MIENQKVKLSYKEALYKLEDIFSNIRKNINSLNGLFISQLYEKMKDNDLNVYNTIEHSKDYTSETIKAVFLENVNLEVLNLESDIIKKDRIYCYIITNLIGLKRVLLSKISQKDLKNILTINDFNYYEYKVIENLNNFKYLIYNNQLSSNKKTINIVFENDKLNDFYLNIINDLTALKGLFLSEIINNERGC